MCCFGVDKEDKLSDDKYFIFYNKIFLKNNGFQNTKNHDYYNAALGLILEDLHDENVLTQNGMLYFIDTVFYIVSDNKYSINK